MQFELVHSERRRSIWWFEAQQGRRQLYLASAVTIMLGLLIGFIAGQLMGDGQIVGETGQPSHLAASTLR